MSRVAWELYRNASTILAMLGFTVALAYRVFSSHAAPGAPNPAPSSTCMGSPLSTHLEGPSLPFHVLFFSSPNSPFSLFKLPQSLPPQSPLTCLIGCGGGFLENVLVHALSEHMLVLLDPRDHPKGDPSQQAEDGM